MPRLLTLKSMLRRTLPLAVALLYLPATAFAEGMPQLDFANPLTKSQVVWGTLIFVVLYLLLSRWALPQVAEVLELRATTIEGNLEAARKAKVEADAAVAELTAATRAAQSEAQAQIAASVAASKDAADAQTVALNAKLEDQLRSAERQIAAARAAAVGALRQVATDTARDVITRLTGIVPQGQAVDTAVNAALAVRGQV